MTPGFLNYFMNSSIFQEKIKLKASRSINQANINATILSNENIQFPVSISEQQAIVRKLDALSSETQRLEAIYQQKLDGLAELKQAVLQKAFAGELTAQPEHFLQEAVA
jgi:type I restriction enzyme, S subunit